MAQTALDVAMARSISNRPYYYDLSHPNISTTADFSSNDYLSLSADQALRQLVSGRLASLHSLLGANGTRPLDGNTPAHVALEEILRRFYRAPAAVFFNSGYDANLGVLGSMPHEGDIYIFDELVHTSIRDGIRLSRASSDTYEFSHNSMPSLERTLKKVLARYPAVAEGRSTVFVVVESMYSMDGDFCPLLDVITLMRSHIPPSARHLIIDEAHSTGVFGECGRGYVSALGVEDEVQTRIMCFSKALSFVGAVVLTSQSCRRYLTNFARPLWFSTSLPPCNIATLECIHEWMSSDHGAERIHRLQKNVQYFVHCVKHSLAHIPAHILSPLLRDHSFVTASNTVMSSPVVAILSGEAKGLAIHLLKKGYFSRQIGYPVVDRGLDRIRVCIRADHTQESIEIFIAAILEWAESQLVNTRVKL